MILHSSAHLGQWGEWITLKYGNRNTEIEIQKPKYGNKGTEERRYQCLLTNDCALVAKWW